MKSESGGKLLPGISKGGAFPSVSDSDRKLQKKEKIFDERGSKREE